RNPYPNRVYESVRPEALEFYKRLAIKGKEQGAIAQEIDEELAAFIFEAIFSGLAQYLRPQMAIRRDNPSHGEALFEMPDIIRIFDQTLDILEFGMGKTQPK